MCVGGDTCVGVCMCMELASYENVLRGSSLHEQVL